MWNRISYKLIVATAGVAFAIITVFAYLMLDAQRRQLLAEVEEEPPQVILLERYQILSKVSQGGFGKVYRCKDLQTNDE